MSMEAAVGRNETAEKVPPRAWAILAVVFVASIAAPIDMFKVPPLAGELIGAFGIDGTTIGWMMSIFSVMGIVLAFPAAGIMRKIGMKATGIVALASIIIGSVLGASTDNFAVMLASRFIEGVSMGLLSVMAPAAITAWFPAGKRGLALGIWGFWVPFANVVAFNVSPALSAALGGWRSVWWCVTGFAVVALALFLIVFKMPERSGDTGSSDSSDDDSLGAKSLVNRSIWILCIAFLVFNIVQNGTINTFYPTFLGSVGYDTQAASSIASVITLLAIPGCVIAGLVSDALKTRKFVIIAGFIIIGVAMWFAFSFTETGSWEMWVAIVLCGLFGPFVTTCVFAAAPEIVGAENAGMGMAVVAFGQNIGSMIGGVALGYLVPSMGWALGSHVLLIPLLAIGLIAVLFIKIR